MFGFASIEHFFASVGKDVVKFTKAIGPVLSKVDSTIEANKPVVEAISNLVIPGSGAIEDAAFNLFGQAAKAIQDGGDAVLQKGINIQLDTAAVAELKALLPAIEQFAANRGIVKPAAATAATH